jgi:hypothetical protein
MRKAANLAQQRRQASFEPYSIKKTNDQHTIAAKLQDPASARDAFIFSEIFKRKYD